MTPCIISKRSTKGAGYPQVWIMGKNWNECRLVLQQKLGRPIRDGYQALHIRECLNKNCINPDHLYEGTVRQNIIDSYVVNRVRFNGEKTHCSKGHEFTPENTRRDPIRRKRHCKICERESMRRYRAKNKVV